MTFTCSRCHAALPTGAPSCPNCGLPFQQPVPEVGQPVPQVYDVVAEKIGFVPNVKKSDNLCQGIAIAGTMLLGVIIGLRRK